MIPSVVVPLVVGAEVIGPSHTLVCMISGNMMSEYHTFVRAWIEANKRFLGGAGVVIVSVMSGSLYSGCHFYYITYRLVLR